jgi:hypothetical protein
LFTLPEIKNPDTLTPKQIRAIKGFFRTARKINVLFEIIIEFERDRFQMDLYRFLVSELHIWRYGISVLEKGVFANFIQDRHQVSNSILQEFDRIFGDVKKCRDILQHFEKYVFEGSQATKIRQAEFDKIDAPINIGNGNITQFQACVVGDRFCASHISGTINSVYVGTKIPELVEEILSLYSTSIAKNSALEITIRSASGLSDFDNAMEQLQTTKKDTEIGIGFDSCKFSTRSAIEAGERAANSKP